MNCKNCRKQIKLRGVDYRAMARAKWAEEDYRLHNIVPLVLSALCPDPKEDWVHVDGCVTCRPSEPMIDSREWFAANSALPEKARPA